MDDEVELLLLVTQEYKAAMATEKVDWESWPSKYGDMLHQYWEQYLSPVEAMVIRNS